MENYKKLLVICYFHNIGLETGAIRLDINRKIYIKWIQLLLGNIASGKLLFTVKLENYFLVFARIKA